MKVKKTTARGAGKKIKRIKYLIVARHGERLDKVFPTLLQGRRYKQKDFNQPKEMPIHGRNFGAYRIDPPLTVFGEELMVHVRESLEEARLIPVSAYCSPSLRCVQTGTLKIEPGLQENWPAGVDLNGKFLTPTEYHRAGFKVALGYQPIKDQIIVNTQNPTAFNERFGETLDSIIRTEDKAHPAGIVLLVGHSTTPDSVIGHLIDKRYGSFTSGEYTGHYEEEPKYGHVTVLKRSANGGWELKENAVKPFSTSTFTTHNQLRAPEEEEEEDDEESRGSTDSD